MTIGNRFGGDYIMKGHDCEAHSCIRAAKMRGYATMALKKDISCYFVPTRPSRCRCETCMNLVKTQGFYC